MNHWTPDRQKIHAWMVNELALPIFADGYRDSVNLLHTKSPGYVSLVSHVCRDIMNIMARAYSGDSAGRVDYLDHANKISSEWSKRPAEAALITGLSADAMPDEISIPLATFKAIDDFVRAHQAGTVRADSAGTEFFRVFLDVADRNLISSTKLKEWNQTLKWFKAHAHLRKKPFSTDIEERCKTHFAILEGLLLTAADSVQGRLLFLNEILHATNH
jgi:hypothetical protein